MDKTIPVKVALRCRPFVAKEIADACQTCLRFQDGKVVIGSDKAFQMDYLFEPVSTQEEVYEQVVTPLIENLFKGYNATILAYGQTGSGKTFTMGTSYQNYDVKTAGIIPRTVHDIFAAIAARTDTEFTVKITFLEIYKEDVIDLLNTSKGREDMMIREDTNGDIKVVNLCEIAVNNVNDTMECLEQGSLSRTTGATAMNNSSSRSHAIFTIHVEQKDEEKFVKAKFHLVDLAGSERAKKTLAQGERFKEGVNINRGLLALGNVISALCEEGNRHHIPYRDSKLTRLLQDSLGGNSHTVMIACVSPADSNMEETLNTIRYACRARHIKNKPIVNHDPQAAEVGRLMQLVQELQLQLLEKQDGVVSDGNDSRKNADVKTYIERIKVLENENCKLTDELQRLLVQYTNMYEKALQAEQTRDELKQKLEQLRVNANKTLEFVNDTLGEEAKEKLKEHVDQLEAQIVKISEHQDESVNELLHDDMIPSSSSYSDEDLDSDNMDVQHALRQAEMNRELQTITRNLAMKKNLASQILMSDTKLTIMHQEYQTNVKQLEEEITSLQKEKDHLLSTVKSFQNNPSSKISEQRRLRLQELENKISQMQKKIVEQTKLIRLKEQNEAKVTKLNQEMLNMKQTRVKLIKQMKEESDKFRQWKQEKEREVAKLKQQDRRRQFELVKMEETHTKQSNVLRRKMEEAVSANRRLKEALAVQKSASEQRMLSRGNGSAQNKVRDWIFQELEMMESIMDAKHHLKNLMENRKIISEQLKDTKDNCNNEESPVKKLKSSNGDSRLYVCEPLPAMELQNQVQLCNVQIKELQQKLVDVDQDVRQKTRWTNIQTMAEAKQALDFLFQEVLNNKAACTEKKSSVSELEANNKELFNTVKKLQNDMKRAERNHIAEVNRIELERDEQMLTVMHQLQSESKLKTKSKSSQQDNSVIDNYEKLLAENAALRKKLESVSGGTKKMDLLPAMFNLSGALVQSTKKKKKPVNKLSTYVEYNHDYDDDSEVDDNDDDTSDPDWRLTPFGKRKKARSSDYNSDNENNPEQLQGVKRKSTEAKCKCKTNCKSKLCSCKKSDQFCSDVCGCGASCVNRSTNSNSMDLNVTFCMDNSQTSVARKVLKESNVTR